MPINEMSLIDRALRLVSAPFEDPVGTSRPLWRDYSANQGQINFDVAKNNGVNGMAARATISWGYQDKWFPMYWSEAQRVDMYRTSYHVIYPDQPVRDQFDNWIRVCPTIDIIPRVIDLEVQNNASVKTIATATWEMSERIADHDGVRPIIYSRYLLVDSWLSPVWTIGQFNQHKWWLAQYLYNRTIEHAGPPTVPQDVFAENIILHQTADKKPGFAGEVQSSAADYDRWEIGDVDHMHSYIANTWGDGSVTQPPANDHEHEYELEYENNDGNLDIRVRVKHS